MFRFCTPNLEMNYHVPQIWGLGLKILGAVLKLDSTANPSHLPKKWAKWAGLRVLFSLQLQNGPRDFNFFHCPGVTNVHCYPCSPISWV